MQRNTVTKMYAAFVNGREKHGFSINCSRCGRPILEGEERISRNRHKLFHKKCFDDMYIDC